MDQLKKLTEFFLKYRYVFLILLVGIVLMLLPSGGNDGVTVELQEETSPKEPDLAQELTQILAQIQGVGKVQVMLTVEEGQRVVYQYDESGSGKDTVIITDAERAEAGLVQQVIPQTYRGAIVVCQGADSAAVRLCVIEAVSKVTGLGTDRISVVKMK